MTKQEWLRQEVENGYYTLEYIDWYVFKIYTNSDKTQYFSYFENKSGNVTYVVNGAFSVNELKKLIEIAEKYKDMT